MTLKEKVRAVFPDADTRFNPQLDVFEVVAGDRVIGSGRSSICAWVVAGDVATREWT